MQDTSEGHESGAPPPHEAQHSASGPSEAHSVRARNIRSSGLLVLVVMVVMNGREPAGMTDVSVSSVMLMMARSESGRRNAWRWLRRVLSMLVGTVTARFSHLKAVVPSSFTLW